MTRSSSEKRAAAENWLADALRDDPPRAPRLVERPHVGRRRRTPNRPSRSENRSRPAAASRPPALPIAQLELLERQQQRILHRTQVIGYILVAEQRNGATLTLGEAVAEFLRDISEAARTSGTILHPVLSRRV